MKYISRSREMTTYHVVLSLIWGHAASRTVYTRHILYISSFREITTYQRCDRGIYSIRGGRSLYCLHWTFSQFMRPEAYSWIFVRVQLGWLSNRRLYQTFSVNPSLLYQAVETQANDDKRQQILSIWPFNLKGVLATFACVPTAWYNWDGFTENVLYKLRLLSQPSCTRTNIQEYASGLMNWLKVKCTQYKLRPRWY